MVDAYYLEDRGSCRSARGALGSSPEDRSRIGRAFSRGASQADDITLLLVRYRAAEQAATS